MSKVGWSISQGTHSNAEKILRECSVAGSPVPVISSVDQDWWPLVSSTSPATVYLFRSTKFGDAPGGMYQGDPVTCAIDWMQKQMSVWGANKAHFYVPYNEQKPSTLAQFDWFSDFNIQCMIVAESAGLKLGFGAFGPGEPSDSLHPSVGSPYTRWDAWNILLPMLRHAYDNGHVLLLHEYGLDYDTLEKSQPYLALRYRSVARFLQQANVLLKIVISEASAGVGYTRHSNVWLNDLFWYDDQMFLDDCVVGCCAYQWGGDETWEPIAQQLGSYIKGHPTPENGTYVTPGPDKDFLGNPVEDSVPPVLTPTVYTCKTNYDFPARGILVPQEPSPTTIDEAVALWQFYKTNLYYSAEDLRHMAEASFNNGHPATIDVWEVDKFPGGKPGIVSYFSSSHAQLTFHGNEVPPEPPPQSGAWKGLHMRANGNSPSKDFEALQVAGCDAAKIMTNTSFDELHQLIQIGIRPDHIVLRLYAAGDNPSLKDAARFIDDQSMWLDEFKRVGGVFVEVHNEPNLEVEGLGFAWKTPAEFGTWYKQVATAIHSRWPQLDVGWPGLSPRPNVPGWIPVLQACVMSGAVDWIGAHAYWFSEETIDSIDFGRYYRRFMNMGAPVFITEFSNNQLHDSDQAKGVQYKYYYESLEPGVAGAFCFVSSGDQFNGNRETWVRSNVLTAIPAAVK